MVTKNIILLQALASMPLELTRLLQALDEATAYQPMADLLSDMIELEKRYLGNFRRVIQEDGLTWAVNQSDVATDQEPGRAKASWSLQALSRRLEAARAKTLTFLSTLSPSDWAQTMHDEKVGGQASPDGEAPFQLWVQHLVEQDRIHLNELAALRNV